ncbi:phosphotransferase family protein [Ornithinibacillus xuwenensis]|uniref:Phosphotransferase n=1 Tax=Ornithinibacillus xuwenensis TaxID=3144668 RepID=A0ABU9XI67_9BACI
MNKEAKILKLLENTSVPIPKLHKVVSNKENRECWVLMEYVQGVTLREALATSNTEAERANLIYQFGQILRQVHESDCPKGLVEKKPWIDRMLAEASYNLERYQVDGSRILLEKLIKTKPNRKKQTLIHGDFTIDNVMVKDGKINKIIDWSGGAFGDPFYDVSLAIRPHLNVFEKKTDKAIFFEGYGDKINEESYQYFAEGLYEFF